MWYADAPLEHLIHSALIQKLRVPRLYRFYLHCYLLRQTNTHIHYLDNNKIFHQTKQSYRRFVTKECNLTGCRVCKILCNDWINQSLNIMSRSLTRLTSLSGSSPRRQMDLYECGGTRGSLLQFAFNTHTGVDQCWARKGISSYWAHSDCPKMPFIRQHSR